jgi:soluble lytic murein transglycosylase-like protein
VDALPTAGRQWSGAITEAADRHGLDPRLLASLVWAESDFTPSSVSHAGAIGLAQLMPGTAAGMNVDPHDPLQNLEGGARYLRAQLDRFGSVDLALAAYNAGPGRVAEAGGIPRIAETQAYVPRVLGHYQRLKEAS